MKTDRRYIWLVWFFSIVLLFIISQTDFILKENNPQVYRVSLILDTDNEGRYINLKKGVDDAAKKNNVDINLVAQAEGSQDRLIASEIENGTDGIIILAKNDLELGDIKVPTVLLREKGEKNYGSNNSFLHSIEIDYIGMINDLYGVFKSEFEGNSTVYVFYKDSDLAGVYGALDLLKSKQEQDKLNMVFVEGEEKEFRTAIEDLIHSKSDAYVFTLDKNSTEYICNILSGSSVYKEHIRGFYAMGSTTLFLNKLNEGIINALSTVNEYDEGYMAVEMLMSDLKNSGYMEDIKMRNMLLDINSFENEDVLRQIYPRD